DEKSLPLRQALYQMAGRAGFEWNTSMVPADEKSLAELQGEIQRVIEDMDYLHQQMQNRRIYIDEQLRRLPQAIVDSGISEDEYERKRATLLVGRRSLVVPEYSVVAQQGMILDNFSDYLVEATKEELTQIVHLMLNKVDIDFDLARICRIEAHPEFMSCSGWG
ncbi:MAG: hypothetical protein AAGU75_23280, partial [Bacillota bacterium]